MALNGLGVMHLKGAAGVKVNREAAIELFTKAAELKYSDAKVNLGLIHLGMMQLLRFKATFPACNSNKESVEVLTPCDFHGYNSIEDPKSYSQACQYFREAVQMQNFQAVYYLGKMYSEELGVTNQCEMASRVSSGMRFTFPTCFMA